MLQIIELSAYVFAGARTRMYSAEVRFKNCSSLEHYYKRAYCIACASE